MSALDDASSVTERLVDDRGDDEASIEDTAVSYTIVVVEGVGNDVTAAILALVVFELAVTEATAPFQSFVRRRQSIPDPDRRLEYGDHSTMVGRCDAVRSGLEFCHPRD